MLVYYVKTTRYDDSVEKYVVDIVLLTHHSEFTADKFHDMCESYEMKISYYHRTAENVANELIKNEGFRKMIGYEM